MVPIRFDVNDDELRAAFFDHLMPDALAGLTEETQPLWGNMTAQHMVEHLLWAFQCSTGKLRLPCPTPAPLLERLKAFLYDNRPTPRGFKNPLLGDTPPPLHFQTFAEAKHALQEELNSFREHRLSQPDAIYVHPVFGPIDGVEWHRSHFKHCYHHLLQFGLVEEAAPSGGPPTNDPNLH